MLIRDLGEYAAGGQHHGLFVFYRQHNGVCLHQASSFPAK